MRVLIIGGGSIGKRHINNLRSLGHRQIWVLKRQKDADFESNFNVNVVTSFQEASTIELDSVFVCTPTSLHNDALAFAVSNQLHIFMEKPLIHDEKGLEIAKQLMLQNQKLFFIGFMLRYHPIVKQIKAILDSNELGAIYAARFEFGSYLPYWHPWEDYRISYAARKALGGGVINTITHELDLVQHFFGRPESVYCQSSNFHRLGIDVEELAEAIFEYDDKMVTLHLDYFQKDYDRQIRILGENGKITWSWHDNFAIIQLHKKEAKKILAPESFEVNQLYIDELQDFINLIQAGKTNHALGFNHAVLNTQLMLSMHESSSMGKKVYVNL